MNADQGTRRWGWPALSRFLLAGCVLSIAGCSDILQVDLPDALTDDALTDPDGAEIQVNSVIGLVECGYAAFTIEAAGFEDGFQATAAVGSGYADYSPRPAEGTCDTSDSESDWFDPLMIGRSFGFGTYERISGWTQQQVPDRQKLLGLTALYTAVALDVFGEHFCDMAIDGGPLLSPAETLDLAEEWVNTALGHIATTGDFEGLNDATTSVETMAYGLRARIRWANGDLSGAQQDALRVPNGFMAFATREAGEKRRNKAYQYHSVIGYGVVNGPVDYWSGSPGPGGTWPAVIPFTGYLDLALLPDGRAVDENGYPITMETPGAVPDIRVPLTEPKPLQGGVIGPTPAKWTSLGDDIPIINWKEIQLILAEIEGGQGAIDRVNVVRAADGLPEVTYANPGDAEEIQDMIIEERRRALWLEGRFWSTKIQNTDKLWFPRNQGQDEFLQDLEGGVRMALPEGEYQLNTNFSLADQTSGCDGQWEDQKPDVGLGSSV